MDSSLEKFYTLQGVMLTYYGGAVSCQIDKVFRFVLQDCYFMHPFEYIEVLRR